MGYDVTAEPLCQYEKLRQEWYEEALPVHEVYLDFFEIDVREVTVAEYDLCITAGVCSDANQQQPVFGDDHPVRGVTWAQAEGYCAWVDKRLCTAAEHEKAARGTDGRKYPWGNNSATASQAVKDTFKTEPAGSKPDGASPFGVLGMVDNGAEWVADVYDAHYYFNSPAENPTGPQPFDGCEREGRGSGGDNYGVSYVPVFHRRHEEPDWDWWYAIRCCR
jgi:formylglycine-generating enzyme required for sulfatase activity